MDKLLRGCSDNQEELSLLSQRPVHDNLRGIVIAVNSVSKEIEIHCLLASVWYKDAQNQKKALPAEDAWSLKCKLKQEEIAKVNAKKLATDDYILDWQTEIEMYGMKAETKRDFNLLTKANSFRETVTEKKELVKTLENTVANLEK